MGNIVDNIGDANSPSYSGNRILSCANRAGNHYDCSDSSPSRIVRARVDAPFPVSSYSYCSNDNIPSSCMYVPINNLMDDDVKQNKTYIKLDLLRIFWFKLLW